MAERSMPATHILPIYPLKDQVVFPQMVFPMFIGSADMKVIDHAMREDHLLGLVHCPASKPSCQFEDLCRVGTVCRITQVLRIPEGGCKVVVEGLYRFRLIAQTRQTSCMLAMVEEISEAANPGLVSDALVQSVNSLLKIALAYGQPLPGDVVKMVGQIDEPGRLADLVAVYLNLEPAQLQDLLALLDPLERLKEVYLYLTNEVQKLQVRGEIQSEVSKRMGKTQKEYLLREQMRQIQEELGDEDPRKTEFTEFRHRIQTGNMPQRVKKVAEKELSRLEHINPASPEYTVARTYLDYLCTLPWTEGTEDNLDVVRAEKVLNEDHYDLTEVKERCLEYLAVRSLKKSTRGPILCFVGPPGVGKTSLGRSIARALGRKFIRISLGGMKDEAEIRGHRRTYIGALPGRIIQEIYRAGTNNPVFMLDEVDKIGQDFRGDPASALLEVLDPEQNNTFSDHYLDVPFDLSQVMFIATANLLDPIPHALKDRMEVISLSGYSDEDKKEIAYKYLIPKQIEECGLARTPIEFEEEAIFKVIRDYTREAGVRNLERQIAGICRKVAKEVTQNKPPRAVIGAAEVEEFLGPQQYFAEVSAKEDRVGVSTGLAWTESGGDIIFVEAMLMRGRKDLILTGRLGDVMQESAKAALSFVRAHAHSFGIDPDFFDRSDIHIHVPAGAIPKDGPSAGITVATALISLLTRRAARRDVAMTGELTLSGSILPIGGVKEKVLAARRAGVTTVLLPERNKGSLRDLNENLLEEINIIFVSSMREVLKYALSPHVSEKPSAPGKNDNSAFVHRY